MSTDTALHAHEHHHDSDGIDVFGFWLYILTDCVLFGALFATYVVLHHPGAYGPSLKPFIDLDYVLVETFLLLGSNFSFGLAVLASYKKKRGLLVALLGLTILLGLGFVGMEVNEFMHLANEGYKWTVSGSASAFFVLVGTHGLHVSFGLIWLLVMSLQFMTMGINKHTKRRLIYLGLFWNFLDIVWIFVFSIVYLMGAI